MVGTWAPAPQSWEDWAALHDKLGWLEDEVQACSLGLAEVMGQGSLPGALELQVEI